MDEVEFKEITKSWTNREKRAFAIGCELQTKKEQLGHGKFLQWLPTSGFDISIRTAERYMAHFRTVAHHVFGAPPARVHGNTGIDRSVIRLPDRSGCPSQ